MYKGNQVVKTVSAIAVRLALVALAGHSLLACHRDPSNASANDENITLPTATKSDGMATVDSSLPPQNAPVDTIASSNLTQRDANPQPSTDRTMFATSVASASEAFQPLRSQNVKDAIHAALVSGVTQRWTDASHSGYAVPGPPGANGCRQVRYTVDDQPSDVQQITACDASRGASLRP